MGWAQREHIYHKESSDIEGAESEFEGLRSQYAGNGVNGDIYETSGPGGRGRLTYLGSDEELPLGDEWTYKHKSA